MLKKILGYSFIAILAIALIGGTIVILTRPNDVEAYGGRGSESQHSERQSGNESGNSTGQGQGGSGQGQGGSGSGQGQDGDGNGNNGGGQGNDKYTTPAQWETITGLVLVSDSELTVDTGDTEILVGLGQSWYREEQGFTVSVGDEVSIEGYVEDGEFKAGTVDNLTAGTSIVLRDASGRPMWSGQTGRNSGYDEEAESSDTGGNGSGNGRGQNQGNGNENERIEVPDAGDVEALACPICDRPEDYDGVLSSEEVTALYLALNDEYHAWAVYDQVTADFGSARPFTNIKNAEASHISSLARLFDVYALALPENPWLGQVDGFADLGSACAAGVQAEIANGALYDTLFASTERADILDVYTALQRASLDKHLPAFLRCAS